MADAGNVGDTAPTVRPRRKRGWSGLWLILVLKLLALGVGVASLVLTGKTIRLPVWAVAEVETRLNRAFAGTLPDGAIAVEAIEVGIDPDWVPRLRLADLRILKPGGEALLTLPDARLSFDPGAMAGGEFRARSLQVVGARIALRRAADGSLDLAFGPDAVDLTGPNLGSFADLLDAVDAALALPALSELQLIEAEALSLTLQDAVAGRTWDVGDGRLTIENRGSEVAADLRFSLLDGAAGPAQAALIFVSQKGDATARIAATVNGVAAADIASQAPPLAWLSVIDAPLSGSISTTIDSAGITALEGTLTLAAGALRPSPGAAPIMFDAAAMHLGYDPDQGRINLTNLDIQSKTLRLKASGHSYLLGADGTILTGALDGRLPASFVTQIALSDAKMDPEGLFATPVTFTDGALDLRLTLDPFSITIGQLALVDGPLRLTARGQLDAKPDGWQVALDMGLNAIAHDRLLALWPMNMVPKTRAWIGGNVARGTLSDLQASLRTAPGTEPRLSLGYDFRDAEVRFLRTLPPIIAGDGYSTVEGSTYTLVLSKGTVTPPDGGQINVAGSVFSVPDIRAKPARAEMQLATDSSLTAALSLLDQPPFRFMTKADRPVNLGQGRAVLATRLSLPLIKKVPLKDVSYTVTGSLSDVSSDVLVPGKTITAPDLSLTSDPKGLRISGAGRFGEVPFDVTYAQDFGPDAKGRAQINGVVTISPDIVAGFGLGLPPGMVSGEGRAEVDIALTKGAPARLSLVSDLKGIGLSLPEIGWTKPRDGSGRLEVAATLGRTPVVERLALTGAGLDVAGNITLRAGGGLDRARFERVQLDDWLDASVDLEGRGAGRPVAVTITGGSIDLRRIARGAGAAGATGEGAPLTMQLDRLQVTEDIALTDFRGEFSPRGGFNGSFRADINGQANIAGTVVPSANGAAVRIQSDNAGAALAAAGVFKSARGGTLDLQLTPRGPKGVFDGTATLTRLRVRDASVLTELLSAISVIGLLEQLNGDGIVFNEASGEFLITPDAVQIKRGSAIGASLGVSMKGIFEPGSKRLQLQGVVSPVYLLNGIGAVFTRRGEGLFGFNYSIDGTASDPRVRVNPLSILTPGMFREIFRGPPPQVQGSGG